MAEKEAQSPASGGSMLKMTANDNTSITSKKQTSLSHSTTTRQSRAPEIEVPTSTDAHEEVDRSAPDYNAIRATFAKMTVENPQVPKNPTERLAKVFAMAAVNGDPTRRKWKAASGDTSIVRNGEGTSVQGLDTLEPPKLPKHRDSGVEREGLPSVWSQAKEQGMAPPIGSKEEHEVVSELQEGSCDEAQEESKLVSVDSGLGVKDGDARATTDAVTIQQPVSTLAPPSLLLDLDLNLNFDDLESCLGFSDAIDSIPSTSATASLPVYSDDARQAAVAPATQFEKHAAVLVAASKLAEANQPPRTFDTTPIPRQPQSRYMDVSGLSHPSSPAQFGGVPMPSSPRRAPATVDNQDEFMASHTKSRTASAATNATVASVTTARSASPRGRKQVTFTPGAEPDNGGPSSVGTISAMGTTTPNPSRTSGIVTLKVSQIGGLEWVLAERQMCYVLVSVSKDSNAAPLFSSRPLLVLSDKVTLHEEASFDLNTSDRLFVEVKLRFERRQPAKSSIFSGFKLGKRDDQVKDVKEEMLAHHALNPIQILSQTAGSVETEEFLVASSKSTVTFTVSTMVMPLTLAAS
ncbi:hypothetical protein BCR44DRAFT_1443627 [Catenaria anguillulae PL171]|uniref:Uncharacterized protein n=1 Tax=Catenaria anguillulae PL171 TaxID=765915 RepID=A0A1Y2H8P2_9FUNG|nr:hypothetical protein BCR44DRAFT_1443627 [Catenaria anguillulae PL171]